MRGPLLPTVSLRALVSVVVLVVLPLLGAAPAFSRTPAAAAGERALAERIDGALKKGGLRGARVSILVTDLASGETLYEKEPDLLLSPASVTKVVTSAAALHVLKPEYRFRAAIYGTGRQVGSVWQGDVWLKAWGDPQLVAERVWMLVDELRKRGLRSIAGAVRVDDSFFDQERFGADWRDVSRSWYNAPHGAVSVNFNTLPVRGRTIAIDTDPTRHAGRYLVEMMRREGIDVGGTIETAAAVPASAMLLASSESQPLTSIVADLNKISNNFIAEQILKTLGAEQEGAPGTAAKGLKVVGAYLAAIGVAPSGWALFDGSGLSHSNRLSARTVVKVLESVVRDFVIGPEFLASLKVAGIDGKARRFQDPLCKRRMRVKTGHLYGVATLAGYGETAGGRRVVFAILANDYRRGRWAADRGIEDVCEAFLALGAPAGSLLAREIFAAPEARDGEPPVLGPEGEPEDDEVGEEGD